MVKAKDSTLTPPASTGALRAAVAVEIALNSVPNFPFKALEQDDVVYFTGPDGKRYKATVEKIEEPASS